ncbi:MAG TPA: HlyD family efflux transporter periplasmic adaptor subunit [Accumulibacter sp.]|uniref:efflux RND transporter periplasmic adaptor subunit n=1 Tax=Accumulibacter sp. TaxID=2053492 RepID=UPI002C3AF8D1|nr:HlyD family efflux transporter periplasmic adaptor subunit [Accumulibacter sp.]HMW57451.1 HlyD family efflux transporter periplasmic adaptor subunit [Accumulibacter sp.]
MMRKIELHNRLVVALALGMLTGTALGHGDEDHSQDAKKKAPAAVSAEGTLGTGGAAALQRLADGSLFVPKPVQRQLGLRTQLVRIAELAATVEMNGRVIPDPETSGRVQAMFAGSVIPGPKGMPTAGRKIAKGEVLAYLRPISGTIERGNQKASLAELEAQLAIAEGKVKRFEQLEGAVPQKEIDAARIEHTALQQRRAYVRASIDSAEQLVAPASGIVSASHHLLAGQVVDAKEVLFEIVDPARLAVEALAYDVGIAKTLVSASALADQTALDLKFVGGGQQLREQALPLLFRITNPNAAVAVGQPVKVIVRIDKGVKGATVPRAALTKVGAGETAVWVHTEAERFVARRIRHQSLDAANVAILDGLHDGDRVVTIGAGLLSQVR